MRQNPYIEEEQTTQWPIEKVQKDKQRSTKHIYKTKENDKHYIQIESKQFINVKSLNIF